MNLQAAIALLGVALCAAAAASAAAQECGKDGGQLCGACDGKEYFKGIPKIPYAGPDSKETFAFKWYNKDEVILGKPMKDWLRFSVAFWHSQRGDGSDPFGSATRRWDWDDGTESLDNAYSRMCAHFEFLKKLGVDLWCYHDRDIAPEGSTWAETNDNLDAVARFAKSLQEGTDIHPLWGTSQLFKHPRYMNGAATSPQADVFAVAAAQVKKCLEVTKFLGGENFVFWGGREGYQSLLNTDMGRELDHLARFFHMAQDYRRKIEFNATFLIEPKPQEPTKHQYDWDTATSIGFLRKYNLTDFKINVECNHATLSGHSCFHEVETARINGMLGNLDANTGDPQTGWDTDQFMADPLEATLIMLTVIRNNGLAPGGINFDAKLRRESTDAEDLVIAHIIGMDTFARGLRNAAKMIQDGLLSDLIQKRYSSWDTDLGRSIEEGLESFESLEQKVLGGACPAQAESSKQELADMILSYYL